MVPSRFGLLEALPRSVGGKVDRKKLPELSAVAGTEIGEPKREIILPSNATEALIVAAFGKALGTSADISTADDFFIDLSGDSLSAVAVICSLREHAETASVTTRDLYLARTPERLSERLLLVQRGQAIHLPAGRVPNGHIAHPLAITVAQTLWLLFQWITVSAISYAIAFELLPTLLSHFGLIVILLLEPPIALASVLLYAICSIGLTVGLKWTLIGRYESIRTPVWSGYYLRHWIVVNAARTIPWNILAGTALYGSVLRALGANVGQRVHIHRGVNLQDGGWDMLTIGDDVTLACEAHIGLVELHRGCLCFGPVTIGNSATVDIRASVSGHTTIERGGYLTALSWLAGGERISADDMWSGVPAARTGQAPTTPIPNASTPLHPVLYTIAQLAFAGAAQAAATIPLLIALFATTILLGLSAETITNWLSNPIWTFRSIAFMLAASVIWVPFSLILKAMALRWLYRVRPAILHRWSLAYILVAHKTNQVESAGRWLSGTLFWPLWLRLAGMNIGAKCEISTIIGVIPESLSVGAESFFADGIYLGGPHIYCGTVTIEQTTGARHVSRQSRRHPWRCPTSRGSLCWRLYRCQLEVGRNRQSLVRPSTYGVTSPRSGRYRPQFDAQPRDTAVHFASVLGDTSICIAVRPTEFGVLVVLAYVWDSTGRGIGPARPAAGTCRNVGDYPGSVQHCGGVEVGIVGPGPSRPAPVVVLLVQPMGFPLRCLAVLCRKVSRLARGDAFVGHVPASYGCSHWSSCRSWSRLRAGGRP
jgi:carbonic anhydrase/acetyltransferase-like protein (isoleucine patch superfamily)